MQNLSLNHHQTYIYRKQVSGCDIRVSLRTKDRFEAYRIVSEVNTMIDYSGLNEPEQIRKIILATLAKLQPFLKAERLSKLNQLLGFSLDTDSGERISSVVDKYVSEKIRTKSWTEKTYETYRSIFEMLPELIKDKDIRAVHRILIWKNKKPYAR